jgi:hypothetical protein
MPDPNETMVKLSRRLRGLVVEAHQPLVKKKKGDVGNTEIDFAPIPPITHEETVRLNVLVRLRGVPTEVLEALGVEVMSKESLIESYRGLTGSS